MGTPNLSRRGLLGALAVAPVAVAAPAVAGQSCAAHNTSPFAAALAKHDAALAAENAFDETYCIPANRAAEAAAARIPHTVVEVHTQEFSTADWRAVGQFRAWPNDPEAAALVQAYDARFAAIAALPEVQHADALTARSDELLTVRCKWRDAAIEAAASNVAELARKFELMTDYEGGVQDKFLPAFRADLERLARGEAA